MAKSGVLDSDPTRMARAVELKKELQKLVGSIVDDDDYSVETVDQASAALKELLRLKSSRKKSPPSPPTAATASSCPVDFKCPLSKEMMRDPVILCTGQTYDRQYISTWLEAGNRTCPLTQQVLSHSILTPNHLIREMISHWCKNHGLELPDTVRYMNDRGVTEADRDRFHSLLNKVVFGTVTDQKEAAKELRQLTKRMPSFRALFGESEEAIPQLLAPLSSDNVDTELQEDVITTLLNLSIHDNNKKLVAETPHAIPLLVEALRARKIDTRTNAAATLFTLSALDCNKVLIGKSDALKPLFDLLEEGNPLAMKDAASAIFNLCIIHDNRARAVKEGGVRVILKKIKEGVLVNELLAILATLCSCPGAIIDIGDLEGVPLLLRIVRESTSERSKENCIAILCTVCSYDRTKWKEVKEEENAYGSISKLAKDGTSRAKRKANGILERFNRAVNLTHTA